MDAAGSLLHEWLRTDVPGPDLRRRTVEHLEAREQIEAEAQVIRTATGGEPRQYVAA